jgi:UDP-2,3-diacylglucosamine hydrolase
MIRLYQWIHPDLGIPLAKWASSMSRNHYGKDPESEKLDDEKYFVYAREKLKNSFDYMLLGHTHRPMVVTNGHKTYVNLGDWIKHFTFAKYTENGLKLFRWIGGEKEDSKQYYDEIEPEIREFE